jgi:hypothetical protein
MAKKDRTGKRQKREHSFRTPDLGYYILMTDAKETEKHYFTGLRESLPKEIQQRLVIKIITEDDLEDIVNSCEEMVSKHPQYAIPWLIIDVDQVKDFDELVINAKQHDIKVGWSNPCIEIWFHCYFKNPEIVNASVLCCKQFKQTFVSKTGIEYQKSDRNIYRLLCRFGVEQTAITSAKERLETSKKNNINPSPKTLYGCTTVHQLVAEVTKKAQCRDQTQQASQHT